mmetsp:Transcript_27356/g.89327  ORF Transcript_27356/g.89327 Transcript_27356/m.89327 type:complete len:259 (+) Transcript_27356:2-778(+)
MVTVVPMIRRPRIEALVGARTLPHTDGFRGFLPNWVRYLDEGARLLVRVDIHFRRSIVCIGDEYLIPLKCEAAGYVLFIRFARQPAGDAAGSSSSSSSRRGGDTQRAFRFKTTLSTLTHIRTVGLLRSCAVLGVNTGAVVVMPISSTISSSAQAPTATFQDLLSEALSNPPVFGPCVVPVGRTDRWMAFDGARHLHYHDGDPSSRRIHVSNHTLEQQMGCSNVNADECTYYWRASSQSFCEEKVRVRKSSAKNLACVK